MHCVLGLKKKRKKKQFFVQLSRIFFHFETCECAVMIKETGKLHFQYRTIKVSQCFSHHPQAVQKILNLVPDLVVLDQLNFTKVVCGWSSYTQVSSYTPPWINSETYMPFISAVFLSRMVICFIWNTPPMHIAWVTITLGYGLKLAIGSQFLFEVNWYLYSSFQCLRFTEELAHRQE